MSTVFNPAIDIPNLAGKVIFLTGGTSGIGKEAVFALAQHEPAHIYFTGRNTQSGSIVVSEIKRIAPRTSITFIPCDLAETRQAIQQTLTSHFASARLDMFIANAGIMAVAPGLTAEGFEIQFGTNFLGHATMLQLLRPIMLRTAVLPNSDVRFVCLSSFGHTMAPVPEGIQFDRLREPDVGTTWQRYGQSKLAGILLARGMAHRFPQITSLSVHPGLVRTDLGPRSEHSALTYLFKILRYTPMYQSAEKGAYNTLWAATVDRSQVENGAYYEPVGKVPGAQTSSAGKSALVDDAALEEKLWAWTEKELEGLQALEG